MFFFAAAISFADDVTVTVLGPDQKPVPQFYFTTTPKGSENYADTRQWRTDANGKAALKNLNGTGAFVIQWNLAWTDKQLMDRGSREISSRTEPIAIELKAATIPKGAVAATPQTCCPQLTNYCLDNNERFLACDAAKQRIRVISADDKLIQDWELGFVPEAVACRADGVVAVAGRGKMALLGADGKKLVEIELPNKSPMATGVAITAKDVFVSVQQRTGYSIYRLDEKLQNATEIVKGLRGCCGQMSFTSNGDDIYIAANCDFLVKKYDRNGKLLSSFGKRDDGTTQSFKGCCEPKNVCFDTAGNIYTAESMSCSVKKFTADGKYINFIGAVSDINSCVRVTIACAKDRRMFILDTERNIIRPVLPGKSKDVSTGHS